MVLPITFALAATSWSMSFACTSRGHGQRPMFCIDVSSIAMTATLSLGVFEVIFTPRSYAQRSNVEMNPDVTATTKSAMAMARPRNQSAFQKADFMIPPGCRGPRGWGRRACFRWVILPRDDPGASGPDIHLLAH